MHHMAEKCIFTSAVAMVFAAFTFTLRYSRCIPQLSFKAQAELRDTEAIPLSF